MTWWRVTVPGRAIAIAICYRIWMCACTLSHAKQTQPLNEWLVCVDWLDGRLQYPATTPSIPFCTHNNNIQYVHVFSRQAIHTKKEKEKKSMWGQKIWSVSLKTWATFNNQHHINVIRIMRFTLLTFVNCFSMLSLTFFHPFLLVALSPSLRLRIYLGSSNIRSRKLRFHAITSKMYFCNRVHDMQFVRSLSAEPSPSCGFVTNGISPFHLELQLFFKPDLLLFIILLLLWYGGSAASTDWPQTEEHEIDV